MSKINYQELREAAEQATQDEWVAYILPGHNGIYPARTSEGRHCGYFIDWPGIDGQRNAGANARYIAAIPPKVALALLDEINALEETRINDVCRIAELTKQLESAKSKLNEQREHYEGVIADGGKRIAELEKQCAESERKALSNFEECAAMAERIEELEQANTRQDANINHQQEGVTQSVTRYIYHYNAVNGSDSMSGIARLTFMIKSQSDLDALKSALSKVGGFRAKAITSLSYLGCEEDSKR
ncbi:ead/Ea22-like family protein [Escherichia coli]|uniref:Ead/Ea22-like family protein n=2 Tax=Escherichia coli TaxID=562 RepID=A0A8E2H3Y4_ECOLX|nr:ead/Ea22-like family protein [Escherichia coli]HBN3903399.1 ead/Ea22-like family protein [Escherichia coli O25b:H4-ST131]EHK9599638.1 ead/Ea22-like family protein [Escherichia coli]EKD5333106.1 ead/Ea22-like family protein [Escherichia coli]ELR7611203.1 ead/Ea22-like family protein [Escherichia coli]MBL4080779.1 ead/Ea22-like family protein [Escherichia coli]